MRAAPFDSPSGARADVAAPAARARGTAPAAPVRPTRRIEAVDSLRGLAILAMIGYHFAFDLRAFGVIAADFESDPVWLATRGAIVTTFLALVGASLVLAARAGVPASRQFARIAVIAACALAISGVSYLVYPRTWIYFGILHCIAVAALLARPLVRRPALAAAIGVAILLAGMTLAHPAFDARALSWIGFGTVKPPTEDYVPLFPWLGVVLLGVAAGDRLARRDFSTITALARAPAWIRFLGRHSLLVYMAHQPLLIGALWLVVGRR